MEAEIILWHKAVLAGTIGAAQSDRVFIAVLTVLTTGHLHDISSGCFPYRAGFFIAVFIVAMAKVLAVIFSVYVFNHPPSPPVLLRLLRVSARACQMSELLFGSRN